MSSSKLKLNRVAIVGGTHGSELTGAYLIKKFERSPSLVKRPTFEALTLFGNPRAFKAGTRYIERDLNRCFSLKDLNNPSLATYEDIRAKEICGVLGTKENSKVDFVIDLHSTTSNMGLTVILGEKEDPLILNLAAYLTSINPLVKFFRWSDTQDNSFLRSVCPRSIAIEVGAIPHGVLNPWYFEQTEKLIYTILDFLNSYNTRPLKPSCSTITIFEGIKLVDYPRHQNGELSAMIDPSLVSKDYQPLEPGASLFKTFEGRTITYKGTSTVYPAFIGEASYQEKGIAMCLTAKHEISLAVDY